MDSSEPSSSGMSGTIPNKKRKSGEEKLTASERSKLWRQQQKERDPEEFREREQSRTRERRLKKKKNQTANLSNSLPIMSNKETQTGVTLAENEIILKCTPLSDSPGRYQFVDPTDRHRHIDLIREENDMDCDTNTGDAWIQDTNRKSSQFGDILNNDTNQFNNVLQPGPSTETQGIPHDAINEWKINTLPEFRIPVTTAGSSIENNPTYDNPTIEDANLKPFDQEMESSSQFPSVPDTRTATDFCPEVAAQGKIPSIPVLFGKSSINRSNACQNMMLTGDCNELLSSHSDKPVGNSPSDEQAQMNHQDDEGQIAYLPNTKNAGIQDTPFLDTCISSSRFGENSDLVEMSPIPIPSDNLDIDTDPFIEILQLVAPKETPGICHDSIQECKPNEQDTLTCSEFPPPVTIVGSSIENNTTNDNPTIEDANLKPFDQEMESSSQFPSVPDTRTATDFCPEVAAQGKIPSIPVLFGKSSINRSNACQNMMLTGDCDQPATPSSDETVMHSGSVAPESPLLPPGSVTSLILDMEQDFPKPVDIVDNDSLSQIARRPIQVTTGNSNHIEERNTGGRNNKELYKLDGRFTFIGKENPPKKTTTIANLLTFEGKVFIRRCDKNFIEEVSERGKVESLIKFSNSGTDHYVKDVAMSQRNGAIWFCCIDNSVHKYEDRKCTEKFRTRFPPQFLYVDSSNSKEEIFVCQEEGLEIWDDDGNQSKSIDLYKPLSDPDGEKEMFYPATVDKDAVSGKVLVISKDSVPILLDKSLEKEPTFINTLPVICPEFRLYCGCFNHAGDIIVGTSSGVYVLSGVNYEVLTTLGPRYGMEPILCLPNYDLWVGCYDEIYRYSYQNKKKQLTQASTSGSHL